MNAPALAAARWVTPTYCEACHANHPGPCGCWCHRPAASTGRDWRTFAACLGVHGIRGGTTPYEREAARLSLTGRAS